MLTTHVSVLPQALLLRAFSFRGVDDYVQRVHCDNPCSISLDLFLQIRVP